MLSRLLQAVKWDSQGLVCAIAQDWQTKRVLMVAWMNAEALQKTAETGFAHYYSRSRQKQWMKGVVDGHQVNIPELCIYRLTEGVTEKGSTSRDWLFWSKVVGGVGR